MISIAIVCGVQSPSHSQGNIHVWMKHCTWSLHLQAFASTKYFWVVLESKSKYICFFLMHLSPSLSTANRCTWKYSTCKYCTWAQLWYSCMNKCMHHPEHLPSITRFMEYTTPTDQMTVDDPICYLSGVNLWITTSCSAVWGYTYCTQFVLSCLYFTIPHIQFPSSLIKTLILSSLFSDNDESIENPFEDNGECDFI